MDQPFATDQYCPSRDVEVWEHQHSTDELAGLIRRLNSDTKAIMQHPYDPNLWLARANTLDELRYPELVVGDCHKTTMLCRTLLSKPNHQSRSRLGHHMGFWMSDEDLRYSQRQDEHVTQRERLLDLQQQADEISAQSLDWPEKKEGRCFLQAYPWMREEHLSRSDELIDSLNERFQDPANRAEGTEPACVVQRYAFGKGVGARDGADLLGVFAARDILKDETIVIDRSSVWGCNGPGLNGTSHNLSGGLGCLDPIHPNMPSDLSSHDLRWVRDRCGKQAADAILKCRFFLSALRDEVKHPLDHPVMAGLTPTYRPDEWRDYSVENDMDVLNDALQQFGVDVFANLNWDTWVFFVIMARAENNNWSDPNSCCLSSLFSMFNHSCDRSVAWFIPEDHHTMKMQTTREIAEGEQLLVCYDGFMLDKSLEERRQRFQRWLNGPCQCTRCMAEESEYSLSEDSDSSRGYSSATSGDWDVDEKPALPEDDPKFEYELAQSQDGW